MKAGPFSISATWENRAYALSILLAILMVASLSWFYLDTKQSYSLIHEDWQDCQSLTRDIQQLQSQPAIADSQALAIDTLSQIIEKSCLDANIPLQSIVRIVPQPSQRQGDSVYLEKPTQILLREVTTNQFTTLLHQLTGFGNRLQIKHLRINTPRNDTDHELWDVETTISYLIYQPRESDTISSTSNRDNLP